MEDITRTSANWRLDFLVIGAQKCATSWLYYCLKDHPQLHLPASKKEVEYLGGDLYQRNGAQWYFDLLAGAGPHQKTGDVSVEYLHDKEAPEVVRRFAPDVKLIVSLRNPVDRALSAYFWNFRKGYVQEKSLEDGLWRALEQTPGQNETARSDRYGDILERGRYDIQLGRYLDVFDPERMFVVLYEDIQRAPLSAIQRIFRYLDVEDTFVPKSLSRRPKQNSYSSTLLALERTAGRRRIVTGLIDHLHQVLSRVGAGASRPEISADLRSRLTDLYKPHIARTQELLQLLLEANRPQSVDLTRLWRP